MTVKDKAEAQPVRLYQRLDAVAEAYRGSDAKQRRYELDMARRALLAQPINQGGFNDPGRVAMQSQQAQLIAEKEEALRAVQALEGDDLVMRYCGHLLNQQPGMELRNSDDSPLGRGAVMQGIAPGMM